MYRILAPNHYHTPRSNPSLAHQLTRSRVCRTSFGEAVPQKYMAAVLFIEDAFIAQAWYAKLVRELEPHELLLDPAFWHPGCRFHSDLGSNN